MPGDELENVDTRKPFANLQRRPREYAASPYARTQKKEMNPQSDSEKQQSFSLSFS